MRCILPRLLISLLILGCGDEPVEEEPLSYVHLTPIDLSGVLPIAAAWYEKEFEDHCLEETPVFCIEGTAGPLDRALIITEACKNCPFEDCKEGEFVKFIPCHPYLDCIPSAEVEILECLEDGEKGWYKKSCPKGWISETACTPCEEEICDRIDNDCDGNTDEHLERVCTNQCGDGTEVCIEGEWVHCDAPEPEEEVCNYQDDDCDGEIDEGQLNICGDCGSVPDEICNGIDDDCDGDTDEDLIKPCSTVCEPGTAWCVDGAWYCDATPPVPEICNGEDDDCDGEVDEDLICGCKVNMIGVLFPCASDPLVCGEGKVMCYCPDLSNTCSQPILSQCRPIECYEPVFDPACDLEFGKIVPEVCNAHDDDCDDVCGDDPACVDPPGTGTDEDLVEACYTGPEDTLNVGICEPGELVCDMGDWGNYEPTNGGFIPGLCLGEQLPEEDVCWDELDNDCDGTPNEEEPEKTDICMVFDWSGSMQQEIKAVIGAAIMFSLQFGAHENIRWCIIRGPVWKAGEGERAELVLQPSDFGTFVTTLQGFDLQTVNGSQEMLYDAIMLSILNISNGPPVVDQANLLWNSQVGESDPPLQNWTVHWGKDAHRVLVVFTDEYGQSFLTTKLNEPMLVQQIQQSEDLHIFTFSTPATKDSPWGNGWEPLSLAAQSGEWHKLTDKANEMLPHLEEIVDLACPQN